MAGTPTVVQRYQYQVTELRRNVLLSAYAEATARNERAARRRCHKDWPAGEYQLHLVWHRSAEEAAE